MSMHLDRLARRVMRDPFFLAAPLARYAESHRLDDAGLSSCLGCDLATLTQLRLCRTPDPIPPGFFRDIEVIAGRFRIDPDALAEVVRFGQALLQPSPWPICGVVASAGSLMAARDGSPRREPTPGDGGGV